jgi:hypothetical protein
MNPCFMYTLFWFIQPLPLFSLTLYLALPFFNNFQHTSVYPLPSQMLFYGITDALLFSFSLSHFPFYPEFYRVVPLLQTCFTCEFVYEHAVFCEYDYFFNLSATYERKHVAFVFLSLAYFT